MKWTPKRVIALAAAGLVAWGASSAAGDDSSPAPTSGGTERTATATTNQPAAAETSTAAPLPASQAPAETSTATREDPLDTGNAGSVPPGGDTPMALEDTAAQVLASLAVKGRAPMTGYDRDLFGQAWSDDVDVPWGHNGCDQRNDILRRDLHRITLKNGTNGCVVLAGSYLEPYSGQSVSFRRGAGTSSLVQIDHVVALADAWQSGAQQWDAATRRNYANDPLVLIAADGHLNQQKGAANAASWLPPNKSFRCAYVARQVAIKARYHLSVTAPEHDAIARVLAGCPGQVAPTDGTAVFTRAGSAASAAPAPAPSPAEAVSDGPTTDPSASTDVRYANCAAVRVAGAAPIHTGQPGYSRKLDRDGDGVACE